MIVNETFESYRKEVNRIDNAMRLLIKHKYKIIDLENQLIHSGNIDNLKARVSYKRVPKHSRVYLKTNKNG